MYKKNSRYNYINVLQFPTFPVLAISLIPNLLKFLWRATIFPGSPVTWGPIDYVFIGLGALKRPNKCDNLDTGDHLIFAEFTSSWILMTTKMVHSSNGVTRCQSHKFHPCKYLLVTSMVKESSEISTIFALKVSTNHMIWKANKQRRMETRFKISRTILSA